MHSPMTARPLQGALACLATLSAGCFYSGSINEPPQVEIEVASEIPLRTFTTVRLSGQSSFDPDGDRLEFRWTARKCDGPGRCGPTFADGNSPTFSFRLETKDRIEVELVVTDELGASTNDVEELKAENRNPEVELEVSGLPSPRAGELTVGRELLLTAIGSDLDRDSLSFEWRLTPPKLSSPNEVVFEPVESESLSSARRLVPDVVGNWIAEVTVFDGNEGMFTEDILIPVVADAPPCLTLSEPRAVAGAPYVLFGDGGPRTFSVLGVADELDPFPEPATPQADDVSSARFRWLVAGPSGEFEVASEGTASSFALDPADYAPGDVVDLRVEVLDRVQRTLPCAEEQATCSIDDDATCLQRVTWRTEIR